MDSTPPVGVACALALALATGCTAATTDAGGYLPRGTKGGEMRRALPKVAKGSH